jgi:hypothetical protein
MKDDGKVFGFQGWCLPYCVPGTGKPIEFKIMGMQLRLIEIPIRVTETPIRLVEIPNIKELIREKGYINGIPITTVYKGGKCWRFIRKDGKILMVNEDKTLRSPTEEELRELREIFPGEKFEGGEPPEELKTSREISPEEEFEEDKQREGLIEEILKEFFGEEVEKGII